MKNKNQNGLLIVDKAALVAWQPALESFFGAQLANISDSKKKLLTAIASKAFENTSEFTAATENVGFVQLTANNSGHAPAVANPSAGGSNGLTSQPGQSGSGDPQFLVGLCLALAAKTIGLELVQTIPAVSQNVTVDYLTSIYNGAKVDNAGNNLANVVTVTFDGDVLPVLATTKTYAFEHNGTIVIGKYVKKARSNKGLIFELANKVTATIGDGTPDPVGALSNIVYLTDHVFGTDLAVSDLYEIDANMTQLTPVLVNAVPAVITAADNTKAIENYIPNQTTAGLNRTLSRNEADKGTDRGITIDLRNENYVIGNRTFTGHIGRLQYKRLEEQGKAPLTFLSSAMLNEFSQEINYQILAAARALGVTNALAFESRGTSFNTYFGPTSVNSKAFDAIRQANELVDKDNNPVTGQFAAVPNLRLTMQYETIASIGTVVCMLIKQACYAIGNDSRYGDGDSVVLGSNLAGYVAAAAQFTELKNIGTVNMDSRTGAKLSGMIGDIKVYVDLLIPESCPIVTVLRSNKEVAIDIPGFEEQTIVIPGLAYLVKDIVSSVEIIPEQTGGRKIIMDNETDLVAVGDNPEKAYLTFAVDIDIPGLTMRTS